MTKADPMNSMETIRSTTMGRPLLGLALVGALLSAAHTHANETQQVVSSNGTTNIVERIDFPVGDIKDIIPAGDKYIIHANPIDSLKDSVAVDALFVMEKDNPNAAFGRTFSKPIHSVAYVPGLDVAMWSYGNSTSTNLVEVQTGEGALKTAGSVSCFIPANAGFRFYREAQLFPSSTNTVSEVGKSTSKQHVFTCENGQYMENRVGGNASSGSNPLTDGLAIGNSESVFVLRSVQDPTTLIRHTFDGGTDHYDIPNMGKPTSLGTVSTDVENHEGKVFFGYDTGAVRSSDYTSDTLGEFSEPIAVLNGSVNSMSATPNKTIRAVSTNSNEMVEFDGNLSVTDKVTPNVTETGYRKVVTDNNGTLLLSNAHSNYFYRVKSR